jgi:DNA-binding NarL/FixJ family response regulator
MKIIICDDQAVVRDGLELLLGLEKDIEVIGTAQDGAEVLEQVAQDPPVLVLTTYDDDEWVFDAIRAGACGYLLKDTPREKVVEAIRGTFTGKSFVDPAVAGKLLDQVSSRGTQPSSLLTDKLTERECDVVRLLAKGLSNAEIAGQLHLSEGTVRNHVSAILDKLGVSDRTQAAVIAIQHGLG